MRADAPHQDRRKWPRFPSRAVAKVVRDSDMMRDGVTGRVENISNIGVCLVLPVALEIGEHAVVELEDAIQRRKITSRMRVERIEVLSEKQYRIGCSLFPGLTTHQILDLRSAR
jgi:hypothetical protein